MGFDIIAFIILLAAVAFAYMSEFYRLKKANVIWTVCAAVCAGAFALVMLMRGQSLINTALGLTLLAVVISVIDGKGADHAL